MKKNQGMQVFIRVCNSKTYVIDVDNLKLLDLKRKIEHLTQIQVKYQCLVYNGQLVNNLQFNNGDTIFCTIKHK